MTRLRDASLAVPAGTMLGGEETMCRQLAVSRATIRQAARIVEREGLLRVRRGQSGGYFACRPDPGFIEAAVASYLKALDAKPEDLTRVATALWIEAVGRAALTSGERAAPVCARLRRAVGAVGRDDDFDAVIVVERKVRRGIFDLIDSRYVELIFDINENFARRDGALPVAARGDAGEHAIFVAAWRRATLMQLSAIADGDEEVATLAARRCRRLLHCRVWGEANHDDVSAMESRS